MNRTNFLLLGLLLLLFSCGKNESITPPDAIPQLGVLENYEPTVTPITGSVDGFVSNENGEAIEGATVKLGSLTTTTNEDGHFDFLSVTMNKAGTLIQVIHPGYFDGSRRFNATGKGVDRVRIQLLQKVYDQSINAETGGQVTIPGANGTIDFSANSIIDANGNLYSGIVDIAVKYLDPTTSITSQQMPGELFGVTEELEEQILVSYGMIAVELIDVNGNPLNLGEGAPATVISPVPADLLGNAPATIPLWSYDEAIGVWVEEGEAGLVNGKYVGKVTHFSWWNFDVPGTFQDLSIKAIDQKGNPLANHILKLSSVNFSTICVWTNSVGETSLRIPAGEVLDLAITLPGCTGVLHTQSIGPFPNPTNSITIMATISPNQITTISGDLKCNGTVLNDAIMKVTIDDNTNYFYGISSDFSKTITTCTPGEPYTVKLLDPTSGNESIPYTRTTGTSSNLGTVDACLNSLSEFLLLNIGGTNYLCLSIEDSSSDGASTTCINASSHLPNGYLDVKMTIYGNTVGSYDGQQNGIYVRRVENNITTLQAANNLTTFDITTSTSTETKGAFSGQLQDNVSNTSISISGSFDVDK